MIHQSDEMMQYLSWSSKAACRLDLFLKTQTQFKWTIPEFKLTEMSVSTYLSGQIVKNGGKLGLNLYKE